MMQPIGRKKLHFIVVGTGRCGTVYLAQLLSSVGLPCSHEQLFGPLGLEHTAQVMGEGGRDSDISRHCGLTNKNFIVAEASYMAVPYLNYGLLADTTIIHLVRNPIDVILSFHNKLQYWHKPELNKWQEFILAHLPEIKQHKTPLMKNCCYVVRWNNWIESQSVGRKYIRIRLEYDQDKLLHYLQVPKGLWPTLGKMNTYEQWPDKRLPLEEPATEKDILNSGFGHQVRLLAEKYGYILSGEEAKKPIYDIHTQDTNTV